MPLLEAIIWGNRKFAKWLLQNGADPNALDKQKNSALHYLFDSTSHSDPTYNWDRTETVKMLFDSAADLSITNDRGRSPLHLVIESYVCQLELLLMLLECPNININQQDSFGRTPLNLAFCHARLEFIEPLLKKGANPYIRDDYGCNALDRASNPY